MEMTCIDKMAPFQEVLPWKHHPGSHNVDRLPIGEQPKHSQNISSGTDEGAGVMAQQVERTTRRAWLEMVMLVDNALVDWCVGGCSVEFLVDFCLLQSVIIGGVASPLPVACYICNWSKHGGGLVHFYATGTNSVTGTNQWQWDSN
eukprot:scaffold5806_cov71-Attheya_sp.AAC.2